jgi:hypothetical protein
MVALKLAATPAGVLERARPNEGKNATASLFHRRFLTRKQSRARWR